MAQAKTPVFGTDIKKLPVVKDVYKESVLEVTNSIVDANEGIDAIAAYDTGNTDSQSMLDKLSTQASDAASGSFDALSFEEQRASLESAFQNGVNVRDLPGEVKNNLMTAALEGANGGGLVSLYDSGKNEYTSISGMGSLDATSILNVVNRIAGSDQIMSAFDLGAQASMVRGLAGTLLKWRVPEMIDKLIEKVRDAKLRDSLYEENAINSARYGDLASCQHFVSKMGSGRAFAIWEVLTTELLRNYQSRNDGTVSKLSEANTLISFLDGLHAKWKFNPVTPTLVDFKHISQANETVRDIMSHHPDYKYFAFAGKIQQHSAGESIGKVFSQLRGFTAFSN